MVLGSSGPWNSTFFAATDSSFAFSSSNYKQLHRRDEPFKVGSIFDRPATSRNTRSQSTHLPFAGQVMTQMLLRWWWCLSARVMEDLRTSRWRTKTLARKKYKGSEGTYLGSVIIRYRRSIAFRKPRQKGAKLFDLAAVVLAKAAVHVGPHHKAVLGGSKRE